MRMFWVPPASSVASSIVPVGGPWASLHSLSRRRSTPSIVGVVSALIESRSTRRERGAAVDLDDRPGRVAGRVAGQVEGGANDLFRLAAPLQRDRRGRVLVERLEVPGL